MSTPTESFPSLIIRPDELVPLGAFAEAQAVYLHPDPAATVELTRLLERHQVGIVAHFLELGVHVIHLEGNVPPAGKAVAILLGSGNWAVFSRAENLQH